MFENPWMMCFDVPWQPYYASAKVSLQMFKSLRSKAWFRKALASSTDSPTYIRATKGKRTQVTHAKNKVFWPSILIKECENAPDIDATAKMGHISSKSAGAAESQTDSFEESPYLGPSGLHLSLQNKQCCFPKL